MPIHVECRLAQDELGHPFPDSQLISMLPLKGLGLEVNEIIPELLRLKGTGLSTVNDCG